MTAVPLGPVPRRAGLRAGQVEGRALNPVRRNPARQHGASHPTSGLPQPAASGSRAGAASPPCERATMISQKRTRPAKTSPLGGT
jgi:hypothetical protein